MRELTIIEYGVLAVLVAVALWCWEAGVPR